MIVFKMWTTEVERYKRAAANYSTHRRSYCVSHIWVNYNDTKRYSI